MNDGKIYGVLKAQVEKDNGEFTSSKSKMSHYNLITKISGGEQYQVNIDIQSNPNQPNVLMYFVENYSNPILTDFDEFNNGFTDLSQPMATENSHNSFALDYLRDDLFPITKLSQGIPQSADSISQQLDSCLENHEFVVVFGTKYSDSHENNNHYGRNRFHNNNQLPGQGVDDIHMNQGSEGNHASANGIYQDGALFVKRQNGSYTAVFFSFQEQCYQTDESGTCMINNFQEA
jgi:uncharacterized protein YukJ